VQYDPLRERVKQHLIQIYFYYTTLYICGTLVISRAGYHQQNGLVHYVQYLSVLSLILT